MLTTTLRSRTKDPAAPARRTHRSGIVLLCCATLLGAGTCWADTIAVPPGGSIQDAIDAAAPGTTILVPPGVYHESGAARAVTITKPGIRLVGQGSADAPVVLEASGGQEHGIWVSPADTVDAPPPADDEHPPCGLVGGDRLDGFAVSGFTIQGFPGFGVYLACVNHYSITDNVVRETGEYSIFPVRSDHGRIARNDASGTTSDACIYVGKENDVAVFSNHAHDCLIGFQIENASHVTLSDNESDNNTAGLIVDVLNDQQQKFTADNLVESNSFHDNNQPNAAPPGSDVSNLVPGIGISIDGADLTLVRRNTIAGNKFAGLTLSNGCIGGNYDCGGPLDIDPAPDGNQVIDNRFIANGTDHSGPTGAAAADVIFLPDSGSSKGVGNCFSGNTEGPGGLTSTPRGRLPSCPPRTRLLPRVPG
jgi:hypothetical protein